MIADTLDVLLLIPDELIPPMIIGKEMSSGTDFTYIRHGGENIRVRTDQLWFWTEEWQTRHEEAISELKEGRFAVYETGEGFLAAMDEAIASNETHNG